MDPSGRYLDLESRTDGEGRELEEEGAELEKWRPLGSQVFVAAGDVLK